jgi:hypothetical protein
MADVLGALGLCCVVAAGFTLGVTIGLVAVGAALLFAGWRVSQ